MESFKVVTAEFKHVALLSVKPGKLPMPQAQEACPPSLQTAS